jgi:hypothetical protein
VPPPNNDVEGPEGFFPQVQPAEAPPGQGGREVLDPTPLEPLPIRLGLPEHQEWARRWLAFLLVGILAVEVFAAIGSFVAWVILYDGNGYPIDKVKELMLVLFGPTVALVGSATGFYFGTKAEGGARTIAPGG